MLKVGRLAGMALALVAGVASAPLGVAEAQMTPQIAMPEPDNGGILTGCYRIQGPIYGQYRMTFCLGRRNNYTVTGGGLNCNGGLDWYDQRNGRVEIDLYRSRCGAGQAWSGDSLSCRIQGWKPWRPPVGGPQVRVPVPLPPQPDYMTLNCRYNPVAGGYQPINVTARRI